MNVRELLSNSKLRVGFGFSYIYYSFKYPVRFGSVLYFDNLTLDKNIHYTHNITISDRTKMGLRQLSSSLRVFL